MAAMTDEAKLAMLGTLTNESNSALLTIYLTLAKQKILNKAFPFTTDVTAVPDEYSELQVRIAEFMYQKRGAEGQSGYSQNGISATYENGDVPESLMREIIPYGGIPLSSDDT